MKAFKEFLETVREIPTEPDPINDILACHIEEEYELNANGGHKTEMNYLLRYLKIIFPSLSFHFGHPRRTLRVGTYLNPQSRDIYHEADTRRHDSITLGHE